MKTAISIPDDLFNSAEQLAHTMKISRSNMYSIAIKQYIERHDQECITSKLNEVYKEFSDTLDTTLSELQTRSLPSEKW